MRTHRATLTAIDPLFADAAHNTAAYRMTALTPTDVPAMAALQIRTGAENVVARDSDYYHQHFDNGHTAIGFSDHNGTLVAHALIRTTPENTTMLNVLVDPQHRGNKLQSQMINAWLDAAANAGIETATARVRIHNFASLKNFDIAGMAITVTEPSPDAPDEMTHVMKKSLKPVTAMYCAHTPACQ